MADQHDAQINPDYYAHLNAIGMSALQVTEAWHAGYHIGQVLKYVQRAGLKPGEDELVDLKKAHWYLSRFIHLNDPSFPNPMKNEPRKRKSRSVKQITS